MQILTKFFYYSRDNIKIRIEVIKLNILTNGKAKSKASIQ